MHNRLRRVFTASAAATTNADDPGQPPRPPPPSQLPGSPAPSLQSQAVSSAHSGDPGPSRKGQQIGRCQTSPAPRPRLDSSILARGRPDSIKVVDVVGSGICGILYKWGNYRKGWRPRWCTLNDGVLTFYRIHGPDRIMVRDEDEIGGKLIGLESFRRMCSRQKSSNSSRSSSPKPVEEIYLKISTVRESRSDEKRFSIYTGTKTVHLMAETSEARVNWLDALNAAKEMFPRTPTRGMHAVPIDDLVASTEKLREQLLKEGVSETAIQDCEQIMKDEFYSMHHQLTALKQKEILFLETIGHLEADKVDLKHTFLDEIQGRVKDTRASFVEHHMSHGRSPSDPDENNEHENHLKAAGNMEERCQDAEDFLSVCSSDSSESELQGSSDEEEAFEADDAFMMKCSYPYVKRRKKLPDPVENEKGFSLWSVIKGNIGKDLTKICLPVYFNEPVSSLQKGFEDLEYAYLIDRAYEWGKRGNNLMRILNIAAFAVSGYASTEGRSCKPFNPLLGETYEADYPDKGIRFISEKVNHHPMVIAFHCDGRGWKFWADCNLKNKFGGRSIQIDPVGVLTLEFEDGEVYRWSKVTTVIYNLILGKVYCDHHGTMQIQGTNEHSCKIKFKESSIIDRNPHQVQGTVVNKSGNTVAKLFGKWNEGLYYVDGDNLKKGKGSDSQSHVLWRRSKPPKFQTRYNLSRFALTLNELTPGLKEKLPPTDSRLRPDQRHLENGEFNLANKEKLRLEERQRQATKMQEQGWKPRWFVRDEDSEAYRYAGGYWEAREQGNWESCPDIFGEIPPDVPNT